MVSLWPFKSDNTASFERTLSTLSSKIKRANVKQDKLRVGSRRYKVLWTLYTSLAYLLAAIILVLVTGWQNWGSVEYTVIAGSPVIIYAVRVALAALYEYRISSNQRYLDDLNGQREEAIEKFKSATKYNSTQELLEKYGAAPKPSPSSKESSSNRVVSGKAQVPKSAPQRTGIAPPPTANIRRPTDSISSHPSTPIQGRPPYNDSSYPLSFQTQQGPPPAYSGSDDQKRASLSSMPSSPRASASFAPNAFSHISAPLQYSSAPPSQPQWYDRLMDLILGDDETRASNRIALVCQHCKLVNGQAPPGVKSLQDVGRWRCGECRGWNGIESEVAQIVKAASKEPASLELIGEPGPAIYENEEQEERDQERDRESMVPEVGDDPVSEDEIKGVEDAEMVPSAMSTRSQRKKITEDS